MNLTVSDCEIQDNLNSTLHPFSAGISFLGSGSLHVTECHILRNEWAGIIARSFGFIDASILDNVVSHNFGPGLFPGEETGLGIYIGGETTFTAEVVGNTTYQNCPPVPSPWCGGIAFDNQTPSVAAEGTIAGNLIYDHLGNDSGGILLYGPTHVTIDSNLVVNNGGVSTELTPATGGIVALLLFTLDPPSAPSTIDITNNIVSRNTSHGIYLHTENTGDSINILNNTIADNALVGIGQNAFDSPEVTVTNCIVGDWDSGFGATDLLNIASTSVSTSYIQDSPYNDPSPEFVDPLTLDYHIESTSGCIGGGVGAPALDFDGETRDTLPDIGADEYLENTVPDSGGAPVVVQFTAQGTTVVFDQLDSAGQTTVHKHVETPELPGNFKILGSVAYVYDIDTSASITEGSAIEICIAADPPLDPSLEDFYYLLHYEDSIGDWEPVVSGRTVDLGNGTVCGKVTHLSNFIVSVEEASCRDVDGDGYGDPGDPSCSGGGETDCSDSNPHIFPSNTNTYCNCVEPNPQGTEESELALNCEDGIDNDCDGLIDHVDPDCAVYSATANAEASAYGRESSAHLDHSIRWLCCLSQWVLSSS